MKRYYRYPGTRDENGRLQAIQVGLDVVIGDALLELIESGIDEDAHFRGSWHDLDDDDLEFFLKIPDVQARMMSYLRMPLINKLREVLAARREETARHMKAHHEGQTPCDCFCHTRVGIMHDHACCSQCLECGFRTKCTCHHCDRKVKP